MDEERMFNWTLEQKEAESRKKQKVED